MCLELQKSFHDRAWNLGTIYAGTEVVNHRLRFMIKSRKTRWI